MGLRGKKPEPTKPLQIKGSRRFNSRKRTDPSYQAGDAIGPTVDMVYPEWFWEDCEAVWEDVITHLTPLGYIGQMDRNALARYCFLLLQWRKAKEFIEQHGQVLPTKDPKGRVKITVLPQFKILMALSNDLLRMEHEFGMTPSARAGFGIQRESGERRDPNKSRFFA